MLSANYELPFGKGRKWASDAGGITDAIIGGWRLSGIFQARSGFPITVIDGRNRSLQGVRGNERPNCVGDPVPSDQNINHWLDINAFAIAPLGTFGDCPIGVARAPGYKNVDAVLAKQFNAGGASLLRVPRRGVQPDQHAELRPTGARHQRAEHLRDDHHHRQHRADGGTGREVLLLTGREAAR